MFVTFIRCNIGLPQRTYCPGPGGAGGEWVEYTAVTVIDSIGAVYG